ncbi:3-hydroxyacyl-CoA dehydrogenase NAD-binding domain-containing protein [Pseudoxanthobacter sp.]|uniref:3-hydroxyacyl-CoA dehydrogenase/enoyl-CoA hydratase family protein n=1 Tax=Pseudoxanthobacter sp. TaxID=1925742 RepID=UPI002FE1CA9D
MEAIRKVGVIGAGTMGSGIAAHLANAGMDVVLLDLDAKVAAGGVQRQLKAGGFMAPEFAGRVTTGSTVTDLALLADADWIIEAVAERLDIKQSLFAALDGVRKPGSTISSNTSTIPLAHLIEGRGEAFAGDFLITHFFNPPRHMRLLELVAGPKTRPEVTERIRTFCDVDLGKGVVDCKDTPGFIGNRIGCYWLAVGFGEAIKLGIDVEDADAVIGRPFGIPGTGIFGLLDLIGIDLMPNIIRSLQDTLPASDPVQAYEAEPPFFTAMIKAGRLGRKSGGGFVRLTPDRKGREVLDLATADYRPQKKPSDISLAESGGKARALLDHPGLGGRYALAVMGRTLAYSAALVPEIADSPASIDAAMVMGYGWKQGPFELIDAIGAKWFADKLAAEGFEVPPLLADAAEIGGFYGIEDGARAVIVPGTKKRAPVPVPAGVISLAALALRGGPVWESEAAVLRDIGDGVLCFSHKTKMNTFGLPVFSAIDKTIEVVKSDFRALVIANETPLFSAGADLRNVLAFAEAGDKASLSEFLDAGHSRFMALKYAPFPVVGAVAGIAFGGGTEVLLHCDAIQAHAETTMGLVETRIGVVPAWGGCKELLQRFALLHPDDPVAAAVAAFRVIFPATTSAGAYSARAIGYLKATDAVTMNRERLLADARTRALALAEGYAARPRVQIALSGAAGLTALKAETDALEAAGKMLDHDKVVAAHLAAVLTGGEGADPAAPVSEEAVEARESAAFIDLCLTRATQDRIRHMIETGKPLRN